MDFPDFRDAYRNIGKSISCPGIIQTPKRVLAIEQFISSIKFRETL